MRSTQVRPATSLEPCGQPQACTPSASHEASDLLRLLRHYGAEPGAAECQGLRTLTHRRVPAGTSLFLQGAPVTCVYLIGLGTFKISRTAQDGYEQVMDFAWRGDVLGLDALHDGMHPTGATALEHAHVYALPHPCMGSLAMAWPALTQVVQKSLSRELARRCDAADMMAAVAAETRLARFLLQLSERHAHSGLSASHFTLRMNRRDIASHLGVAHETVSRTFSELATAGVLSVRNRDIRILDHAGLQARGYSTRRSSTDRPKPPLRQHSSRSGSIESSTTGPGLVGWPCSTATSFGPEPGQVCSSMATQT